MGPTLVTLGLRGRPSVTSDATTGVIFDLDGVLADSQAAIVGSFRAALLACGHEDPGDERLRSFIGPPPFVAIGELLGLDPGEPEVARVVEAYRADYVPSYLDRTPTFAGIPEALAELATRHRLAVATSKPHRFAVPLVARLGFGEMMVHVAGPGDDKRVASKQADIAEAFEALGVERAVMVGDRRFDVEGARANGLPAVGVLWGIGDRSELEAAGASRIVGAPGDLPAACDALVR